jgi:heat-inducible transcriptional repressor
MLSTRQSKILNAIIKEYIKSAEPVGSELLVDKYNFNFSSATVRAEMLEIDRQGFLAQPHTSAGRIPTEKAYHHFLSQDFKVRKLTQNQRKRLDQSIQGKNRRQGLKSISKSLADLSGELILLAFSDNDFYYTGLTNLFSQPEFSNQDIVCNISTVIDHLDRRLAKLFYKIDDEVQVLVGSQNPIDQNLSLIAVKVNKWPLLAILGPMRMDYGLNVGLLEYSRDLLK